MRYVQFMRRPLTLTFYLCLKLWIHNKMRSSHKMQTPCPSRQSSHVLQIKGWTCPRAECPDPPWTLAMSLIALHWLSLCPIEAGVGDAERTDCSVSVIMCISLRQEDLALTKLRRARRVRTCAQGPLQRGSSFTMGLLCLLTWTLWSSGSLTTFFRICRIVLTIWNYSTPVFKPRTK